MPWVFLVASVTGALFTVNAFFPRRGRVLLVPSFFASWFTIELAGHGLIFQAALTVGFGLLGAFDAWPGWVGLAVTAASWVGLVTLIAQSRRSATTMRAALVDLVGDEAGPAGPRRGPAQPGGRWRGQGGPRGSVSPRVPLGEVLVPFRAKRPGVRRTRNVTYRRVAGRTLRLDVYEPATPPTAGEPRPSVIQIHGGAWVLGDKREQGIPLLNHLAANGWVGFNVNYRLAPGASVFEQLVDLKCAVAWVREHAADHGADPDFICVTGGSAGGHLTALLALTAGDRRYQPGFEHVDTSVCAAVPFYGVYDLTNRLGTQSAELRRWLLEPMVVQGFYDDEPERFAEASPTDRVHADAPPTLVIHGDRDSLVPVADARHFVERLDAVSDAPVLYAELGGSQHAFDVFASIRTSAVVEGVERFLTWVHRGYLDERAGRSGDADEALRAEAEASDAPDDLAEASTAEN